MVSPLSSLFSLSPHTLFNKSHPYSSLPIYLYTPIYICSIFHTIVSTIY